MGCLGWRRTVTTQTRNSPHDIASIGRCSIRVAPHDPNKFSSKENAVKLLTLIASIGAHIRIGKTVCAAPLLASAILFQACATATESKPIVDVRFDGPYQQVSSSMGIQWTPSWGRDNALYTAGIHSTGFGGIAESKIAFGRLDGDDYAHLQGSTINPMVEYEDKPRPSLNGPAWIATSTYSVDGVLYVFVACRLRKTFMCRPPNQPFDHPQPNDRERVQFLSSSIISSKDSGRTWTRAAEENFSNPMFPGHRFGAPFFVWFGKDGTASVDNADRYIYAVSNDGYFFPGDSYSLGRVSRTKLPALNPADWSFYQGGDGLKDTNWNPDLGESSPILTNPGKASITGMTYISGLGRYVMVLWHYNNSPGTIFITNDFKTTLEFFESPKPWGPWTKFKTLDTKDLGWNTPLVAQRFQAQVSPDTVTGLLYVSGNLLNRELTKLNFVPITLSTEPLQHTDRAYVGEK